MKDRPFLVISGLLGLLLVGWWYFSTAVYAVSWNVGKNCIVQFRRGDALGGGQTYLCRPQQRT
jgi:hypothetical protein